MQPIFPIPEVPSAGEVLCPRPLRARSTERCPRWPARGAAARVHRSFRKLESFQAPTRPAGAQLSLAFRGPHALLRLLQMKCFHEHDDGPLEHPRPPNPWVGRLPFNDRGKPLPSRATAEGTQGQGSRINRISTFPEVIAHPGDFAPTPIAPGTSCREAPFFALSGETWGENGSAVVASACTAGATRGSCDARFPRRNPTFTNPRCLPPSGRPRRDGGEALGGVEPH